MMDKVDDPGVSNRNAAHLVMWTSLLLLSTLCRKVFHELSFEIDTTRLSPMLTKYLSVEQRTNTDTWNTFHINAMDMPMGGDPKLSEVITSKLAVPNTTVMDEKAKRGAISLSFKKLSQYLVTTFDFRGHSSRSHRFLVPDTTLTIDSSQNGSQTYSTV